MAAKRRKFTEEEQRILKENPYTYRVYQDIIRFTMEFKKEFVCRYEAGMAPSRIVEELGYSAEMLGVRCVGSIYRNIQKQMNSPEGLHEGRVRSEKLRPHSTDYSSVPPAQAIKLMQHELLYLRQEMEFLKKIITADDLPKRGSK